MKNLKELRVHNNLSRKEVAQYIGVSDRVYAYYEQGRTLPAKYVKPLANLFGISCDEFLENNTDTLDWEREFGCIERTERLELPTWEEFNGQKFVWFFNKDHKSCCLHYLGCSNQIFINVDGDVISIGDLTKENYTVACRKVKELFLKGNVND